MGQLIRGFKSHLHRGQVYLLAALGASPVAAHVSPGGRAPRTPAMDGCCLGSWLPSWLRFRWCGFGVVGFLGRLLWWPSFFASFSVPTSMYGVTTRERLVVSAQSLLWERGYVGTSPKAIQERAGAGQGSMYHHFSGKSELALEAVRRSAAALREAAEVELSRSGSAFERISAYLLREREVLRGCPLGRLAQDPEVVASPVLREPVEETFTWLRGRLASVIAEDSGLDPVATAEAIVAVLQGGYVLARAADSVVPFEQAVSGALGLLRAAWR